MRAYATLAALVATLAVVAGLAVAQESPAQEQIIAQVADPGQETGEAWKTSLDELDAQYPAVGRALRQIDRLTTVGPGEEESTRAFFEETARRGYVLDVDGTLYTVALAMASGGLPPAPAAEGETPQETQAGSFEAFPVVGVGLAGLAVLVVLGLVAVARRS